MCYEYALSFVPSPKTLNSSWFLQPIGEHPGLPDTRMTLWLRPEGGGMGQCQPFNTSGFCQETGSVTGGHPISVVAGSAKTES